MLDFIRVQIVRFVDDHQPGRVECDFEDADGRRHVVRDKVPIFTCEDVDADSHYPAFGIICCEVLERFKDAAGREVARISTENPWGVEALEGLSEFVVLFEMLARSQEANTRDRCIAKLTSGSSQSSGILGVSERSDLWHKSIASHKILPLWAESHVFEGCA